MSAAVLRFSQQWDAAMITNDAEAIGAFMSDDWVIIGTDGGITSKASFLQTIISGELAHNRMNAEEVRTRIYGNTAVLTSRGTSAGLYKGQAFHFYEWATSVFVKENDRWQCVLTMLTPAHTTTNQ